MERRGRGWCVGVLLLGLLVSTSAGAVAETDEGSGGSVLPVIEFCEGSEQAPFYDRGTAHAEAIDCLSSMLSADGEPIIRGFDENRFGTGDDVSRAAFASLIHRLLRAADVPLLPEVGEHPFVDVGDDNPHREAIGALFEAGLLNGVGGDRFAPHDRLSRAQAASVMERVLTDVGGDQIEEASSPFLDLGQTHGPSIEALYSIGIVAGIESDRFGYTEPLQRGQAVTALTRVGQRLLDLGVWDTPLESGEEPPTTPGPGPLPDAEDPEDALVRP